MKSISTTYKSLLTKVRNTLIWGQQNIEAQKIKTYWETGRLIHEDILKHKDRGDYGAELIARLAQDLGVNLRILQYCTQFARTYPRPPKVNGRSLFKWTHYRELISIPDSKERLRLEKMAAKNCWSAEELGLRIKPKAISLDVKPPVKRELLVPKRGTLYTYRIVKRPQVGQEATPLLLDLGFGVYKRLTPRTASKFTADQIVESEYDSKEESYLIRTSSRTTNDLFTYQAAIEKVIDGDTLKVRIDLGFDLEHRETLRLRDIDSPEVGTNAGDRARAFVQSFLKEADTIVLHTTRSDKYDRYLADVFLQNDVYLNNLLIEKGHAVRL